MAGKQGGEFRGEITMMHTLFQVRLLLGLVPLLGGVLWFGMSGGATHYDKSPHEVKAAIAAAYLPTHILGSYIHGSKVTTPDENTVVTSLLGENDAELWRFVTTVTPDGTGSEVDTVVQPPQGEYAERAQQAMKTHAYTMTLMEKLADEHVAAAIEGRPFDMLAFNPAAKAMANATGYGDTFAEANASAMEMARAEQDDRKNGEGWADDSSVEPTDPTPMDDTSGSDWAE